MNKEQKKFKEVIKKRRKRALRKLHPKPKFKFVTLPQPKVTIIKEKSWWQRLLSWLKRK